MSGVEGQGVQAVVWDGEGPALIDQRALPARRETVRARSAAEVARAIREMVVRGAPAIGITAAYGVVVAARDRYRAAPARWREQVEADLALLADARPTAVNLRWAIARMRTAMRGINGDPVPRLLDEARRIHAEDVAANRALGALGAALIEERCAVLTHCNAGALATGGYGTALGVVRSAFAAGRIERVLVDETRPWLQGARLTAWELVDDGIPVRLLADGAAAWAMRQGGVRWVVVGADRIAANGDVANKIGTYSLAVNARHHGVGFMVAAPTSTIDLATPSGERIPIESRPGEELVRVGSAPVAAPGAEPWNPAFDVTPAGLVDVVVTERGVVHRPDRASLAALMKTS